MKKIHVSLGDRSYNILTARGAVKELPAVLASMNASGPIVVITDANVKAKVYRKIVPVLNKLNGKVIDLVIPASEKSKSIKVFSDTVQAVSRKTKGHKPVIVALGGVVVGDLAGFVAATFRRGVPYIQIPTTLLAQVDSSIGGKVGIDIPEAKNLIGAFHQPAAVLIDPDFLCTLPERQIRNGLGEVIKYGMIKSRSLFDSLEKNRAEVLSLESGIMGKIVFECASIKARVVEKDEHDTSDIRIILNFGHTLGHAIEAACGYSHGYSHGEAVAIGMALAGEIAVRLDMFPEKDHDRMKGLLTSYGFSLKIKGVSVKGITEALSYDKKFVSGANRFVLPKRIGAVEVIDDIPGILIRTVLRKYVG